MTPTIETTLGALVGAEAALRRLADQAMPIKAAYGVAKLLRLVADETRLFHAQREAAIRELGSERFTNGQPEIAVGPVAWPEFQRRMEELGTVPVTLAWGPLSLEALGPLAITPADVLALEAFIVESP